MVPLARRSASLQKATTSFPNSELKLEVVTFETLRNKLGRNTRVKTFVSNADRNSATTEGIPCVTNTFAVIGITRSYGATRNPLPSVVVILATRRAPPVLRENFVMAKTTRATIREGTAATTTQWTRWKRGALAMEVVNTAALDNGDIPLLKQVLETTVLVT